MKVIPILFFLFSCATDEICLKKWDGEHFRCMTPEERCQEYRMYCPENRDVVETTRW